MRSSLVAVVVGLAIVSGGARGSADEGSRREGPRVRVTSTAVPSGRLVGTLVGLDGEALTVKPSKEGAEVRLKQAAIDRLEVSRRRGNRGKAVGLGVLVGAAAAGVLGLATGDDCRQGSFVCFDRGTTSAMYGVVAVPAGALIGLAFSHGEKWEITSPDRLRVVIAPTRAGAAFRVSFEF
jgi:hypothetical protein